MKRILLVIENYNEAVYLETLFKKIGIDCIAIRNELSVAEHMMTFKPDLVIATAIGKKVNGIRLSQKLTKSRKGLKFVALLSGGRSIPEKELLKLPIDGIIEAPAVPLKIIELVSKVLGLDLGRMRQKFDKLGKSPNMSTGSDSIPVFSGGPIDESIIGVGDIANSNDRIDIKGTGKSKRTKMQRYQEHLDNLLKSKFNGLPRDKVNQQVKEFRKREQDPEIKKIDEERLAFAKALFSDDKD